MKFLKLPEVLMCFAILCITCWSTSVLAQVIIVPQEGDILPDALRPVVAPQTKTTASAMANDAKPEKRNPFWPIEMKFQDKTITTNVDDKPPPPIAKEVDWNKARKFVKENKKLSTIAGKIHLAFNGRIYEIDSLMDVTLDGNIYTFKVMGGGELEQHKVRPEEN